MSFAAGKFDLEERALHENRNVLEALAKALRHFGSIELEGGALCQAWMPRPGPEGASVLQTKVLGLETEHATHSALYLVLYPAASNFIGTCRACHFLSLVGHLIPLFSCFRHQST